MNCFRISETGVASFCEIPLPEPAENEVLIKLLYVGLCGSDLTAYKLESPMAKYPLVPGHEIAGNIEKLGNQVSRFKPGDQVTVRPYFHCGHCSACKKGRPNACKDNHTLGVQIDGSLTEYICIDEKHVLLCDNLSPQLTALVEPLAVGFHLSRRCCVSKGDVVTVFGCGAIGLGAISAAVYAGATVIAVDIDDTKLSIAQGFGAAQTINSATEDVRVRIFALTDGVGSDICIDAAGVSSTFLACCDVVCFAGHVGVVSYMNAPVSLNTKIIVSKELDIYGSRNALDEFPDVIHMMEQDKKRFERMITSVYPFEDSIQAFSDWAENPRKFTKILISFTEGGAV